jgi:hypothetical protein
MGIGLKTKKNKVDLQLEGDQYKIFLEKVNKVDVNVFGKERKSVENIYKVLMSSNFESVLELKKIVKEE